MKRTIVLLFVALFAIGGYAQNPDDICGIFHSVDPFSKEGSQCEIYRAKDGTYEAKVVWVENPKKKPKPGTWIQREAPFAEVPKANAPTSMRMLTT